MKSTLRENNVYVLLLLLSLIVSQFFGTEKKKIRAILEDILDLTGNRQGLTIPSRFCLFTSILIWKNAFYYGVVCSKSIMIDINLRAMITRGPFRFACV